MLMVSIINSVNKFFEEVLDEKCRILGVVKDGENWKSTCEVQIDPEYTTRKGIGDMVEIYNVYLDDKQEIVGYEVISTQKRAMENNGFM